jgi:hypothetical protein
MGGDDAGGSRLISLLTQVSHHKKEKVNVAKACEAGMTPE